MPCPISVRPIGARKGRIFTPAIHTLRLHFALAFSSAYGILVSSIQEMTAMQWLIHSSRFAAMPAILDAGRAGLLFAQFS
jgi:hypothetical protein